MCSLDPCPSPMTSTLQSCRGDSKLSDESLARRCKEVTNFYKERLCESDLVEIQIREIIEMASKEHQVTALESAPVRTESPLGFSLKRSVKMFLEKRKKRSKSVAPHSYICTSSSSSSNNF